MLSVHLSVCLLVILAFITSSSHILSVFKVFKGAVKSPVLFWSAGQLILTVALCLLYTPETCAGIRAPFWKPRWTISGGYSGSSREPRSWSADRGSWSTQTAIWCSAFRWVFRVWWNNPPNSTANWAQRGTALHWHSLIYLFIYKGLKLAVVMVVSWL